MASSPTLMPDRQDLLAKLKAIVGSNNVLFEPADLAVYECDAETLDLSRPDIVVLPGSTAEVQAVVAMAASEKIPVSPRGAGTGLSGGATPVMGGISLVLTRLTRIIEIDPQNQIAIVETGVTNAAVSKAAAKYGLYFAPDPSSQAASTIGGNIAENAGGAHTLKYGTTVNHVLGVKVVLADGTVTEFGGRVRSKLGLNLLGTFVGSEGTLGIATEAILHLLPVSESVETLVAYFPSLEAGGQAVSDIVAAGVIPAAMEMIDQLTLQAVEDALHLGLSRQAGAMLIVELEGPKAAISAHKQVVVECLQANQVEQMHWAQSAQDRASIWKARKSAFGCLGRIAPHGYVLDGVIPRSKLAQAIAGIAEIARRHELLIANVYHAGDGNLHPCLLFHRDNESQVQHVMAAGKEILELCVELGGTLSGEHGIGIEKAAEMPLCFSAATLSVMEQLKRCFDPEGLLNPGKILPSPRSCGESGMRPLLRHQLSTGC
jgi:glycolate oxidase